MPRRQLRLHRGDGARLHADRAPGRHRLSAEIRSERERARDEKPPSDIRPPRSASLWRLVVHTPVELAVITFMVAGIYTVLWLWSSVHVGPGNYHVRDLLEDGADISLKLGAVVAGAIAICRYWYQRYEPLVFFTRCGIIPNHLRHAIDQTNPKLRQPRRWRRGRDDAAALVFHDLPVVVLQRSDMNLLHLKEGAQVDLEFERPDGSKMWAIAFAFSYPGSELTPREPPVALSLSLREYFRIDRAYPGESLDGTTPPAPPGYQLVEVNRHDLANLSATTRGGAALAWLTDNHYTVSFRDPKHLETHYSEDVLDASQGRILEYGGIALRVMRRSSLRYRS